MLRRLLHPEIWKFIRTIYYHLRDRYLIVYYSQIHKRYGKILKRVQQKEKIKVAFFVIHEAVWKYDGLFKLLEKDHRFDPLVVVCPYMTFTRENMLREMDQSYNGFLKKGYRVVRTFDPATRQWLDVKREVNPDIIFYCVPHKITRSKYFITSFLNTLNCYVPYTFQTTYHFQQNYNAFFHNALWKAYYPSTLHLNMAIHYGLNSGKNAVLTGYPGIDRFLGLNLSAKAAAKKSTSKKNIIWAPHHTIEGNNYGHDLFFSNFIRYHNFMQEMAILYKDQLFLTFKPHPALRPKLSHPTIWGVEKTEQYYNFWQENDFCALNQGNYESLFEESDAMIHDCDSFMGEYLSLNKPVLYTRRDGTVEERMNEFGRKALKVHYQASNEQEIMRFVEKIVLQGEDSMKDNRSEFIKNYIMPPHQREPSMNIYMDLKKSLEIN